MHQTDHGPSYNLIYFDKLGRFLEIVFLLLHVVEAIESCSKYFLLLALKKKGNCANKPTIARSLKFASFQIFCLLFQLNNVPSSLSLSQFSSLSHFVRSKSQSKRMFSFNWDAPRVRTIYKHINRANGELNGYLSTDKRNSKTLARRAWGGERKSMKCSFLKGNEWENHRLLSCTFFFSFLFSLPSSDPRQ